MAELTLYFAPDTCARVALIALEEVECPYTLKIVAMAMGQHRSPEYLALNPSGKVPILIVDGEPLTENVAILSWLADHFPHAFLLPSATGLARYRQLSDLAWCASGLHPIVTRLRIPQFFCDHPGSKDRVFALAETALKLQYKIIEERLSSSRWWYGAQWSIVDAYINWTWFRVTGAGFDASEFPNLARHDAEISARPSVVRSLARTAEVAASLEKAGLATSFVGNSAIKPASQ